MPPPPLSGSTGGILPPAALPLGGETAGAAGLRELLFGGRFPGAATSAPGAAAAEAMLARLQGLHRDGLPPPPGHHGPQRGHLPGTRSTPPTRTPPPAEPPRIPPDVALKRFLDEHGEAGEKSRDALLEAIGKTEESLAKIHSWDRSQGLRKCHSRTVVKTRRSRARVKAFLMGLDPPREPSKKRRKARRAQEEEGPG